MSEKNYFIKNKDDLKRFLNIESKKYNRKNTRTPFFEIGENRILWKYQSILRKAEYYSNTNNKILKMIYKIRLSRMAAKYGIGIKLNCFDCGLHIMHIGNILVNGNARIGKNCSIHIGTGIVAGGKNSKAPVIGDNVVIGIGAKILGDIFINNGIAIGANAVVNKSFEEENIAIAGVPAKKISNNGTLTWNKE